MRRPANPAHGAAWVTGASSGIGQALVRELAKRGFAVAASARSAGPLEALAADNPERIMAAPCDVADLDSVLACAGAIRARFGAIGTVVSNAGVYLPVPGEAPRASAYRQTYAVNVLGAAHLAEAVLPGFAEARRGHFHIVSSATAFGGMPTASAYGASKAALVNMAECLKIELERFGVGVSVSTPGFVKTPAQDETPFPKPFMITADEAARRIADGLAQGGFEITFPRRFTWTLKALYALPRPWRLPLIRAATGWNAPPGVDPSRPNR
jgi:NAD(P)-dependent dehydrogenase (short-subunit alcohol dehydrogenase family)